MDKTLCIITVYCLGACHNSKFTCDNEDCAPLDTVCDGREHCIDGSDELYCSMHAVTSVCVL